jgi:alpha-1,6-mannosyltransferase
VVATDRRHERDQPDRRGRRELAAWVAAGAVGATATAVGGALAGGSDPRTHTAWLWEVPQIPLRAHGDVLPALAVFYGGLLLLARAWIGVRRAAGGADPTRAAAIALLWALPLALGPPLASRDVYSYAALGALARHGHDVYAVGPEALGDDVLVDVVDPRWRSTPTPYGPVFVALSREAAAVSDHPAAIVMAFRALALAGLAVGGAAVSRLARELGRPPGDAVLLLVANPLTLLHLVSGAHNEALMVGLLVAAVAVGRRPGAHGLVAGTALCALAAAVKLPAVVALPFIGWARPAPGTPPLRRLAAATASTGLGIAWLAVASGLMGYGWRWTTTVAGSTGVDAWLSVTTLLGRALDGVPGLDALHPLAVARAGGVVALAVATAWLLARSHRLGVAALASALLLAALLGPTVQPWYVAWGLALAAAHAAGRDGQAFTALSIGACFVTFPMGPDAGALLARSSPGSVAGAVLLLLPFALPWRPHRPIAQLLERAHDHGDEQDVAHEQQQLWRRRVDEVGRPRDQRPVRERGGRDRERGRSARPLDHGDRRPRQQPHEELR